MKLRPIINQEFSHFSPIEWRFKKKHINGKVIFRKKEKDYYFIIHHTAIGTKNSLIDNNKTYKTKEEAAIAAENAIELWYTVQGRLFILR